MRCKALLGLVLSIAVLMATALASGVSRQSSEFAQPATGNPGSLQGCASENEVADAVRTLYSGRYEDQQQAVAFLKADSDRSSSCRKQVITNLMSAMDQPSLDLTGGSPQFFLWHYGTRLLGELKATEALDLLIANFDRHDGNGFPLNHYPALGGVIKMGEIALPKLQTVLRENPDRFARRHAVFCIALIGGRSAHQILRQALEGESDSCVVSCIRATLTAFNNRRRPYHISDESRAKWYTTFLCNGV